MTPRERQLAAICHLVPDRVPLDAICIENCAEIAAYLGVDPGDVLDRLGIDGRIVSAGAYLGDVPTVPEGQTGNEWGSLAIEGYGTAQWYPLSSDTSITDIERYPWPDPELYDFGSAALTAQQLGTQYAVRGPYWKPLFCQVCSMLGMEQAMLAMAAAPLVFETILEYVFQHTAKFCELLLSACGESMPILCLGDDFATQRGLMVSPEQWRRFLKPRYASLFEIGKRAGKYVWFHSCGDITAILPDLVDIGLDVWETVQLHALPIGPEALKREYGRAITFFGGVNTQRLPFSTPDETREEVIRCIEALGRGGGYICGPDHHIKPDVPPANAVAIFDTALSFWREGYTLH